MYREDGKLAARGRHVKYLPMGWIWDLGQHPLLFSLFRSLSERTHQQIKQNPDRVKARAWLGTTGRYVKLAHSDADAW